MNQYYYESRAKEKIRELQAEGMRSQAYHRSGAPRLSIFHGLQQMLKAMLGKSKGKKVSNAETLHTRYARPVSEE
jgi:hypothetical protein